MDVGNVGFVVAGLIVGFIVGMTGVGGGSLMTPILLWFGINPATAVGTDLLYAAITKSGGVLVHGKNKNIDWTITGWLTLGSVPAVLLTLWFLASLHTDPSAMNAVIKQALGVVLLLTALAILFKQRLLAFAQRQSRDQRERIDPQAKPRGGLKDARRLALAVGALPPGTAKGEIIDNRQRRHQHRMLKHRADAQ